MYQSIHTSYKTAHLQPLQKEQAYSEPSQVTFHGSSESSTPSIKGIQFLLCDAPSKVRSEHANFISQRKVKQSETVKLKYKVKNLENQIKDKEQQIAQLNGTVIQLKSQLTILQGMIATASFNIDATLRQLLASANSL